MSSLEPLDANALPLNMPLLLMTAEGSLLKDNSMVAWIELQRAREGAVEIRRSGTPRILTRGFRWNHDLPSIELDTFSTPGGMAVFTSRHNKWCLGIPTKQGVECKNAYEGKWQEWQLLKPVFPPTLLLEDLAAVALSDSTARRHFTLYLLEAGNSCETVAKMLAFLYGTPQAFRGELLSVPERQEQALLKLINPSASIESIRAMMTLVYRIIPPLPVIKSEQATVDAQYAADGERWSRCGDQYVKVDRASVKFADIGAIPLNSPLVMVSSTGATLDMPEMGSCFVELNGSGNGLVTIHSAADNTKCLVLNAYRHCVFGSVDVALKFTMKLSTTGRLLLVEHLSGCVLETAIRGEENLVICKNLYSTESQSWLLFTPQNLAPSSTASGLKRSVTSPDARRQLIMELALAKKSSSDVAEALELLYGSEAPTNALNVTDAMRVERLRQILELHCGKVPTRMIGKFLFMLYGTSAPL